VIQINTENRKSKRRKKDAKQIEEELQETFYP